MSYKIKYLENRYIDAINSQIFINSNNNEGKVLHLNSYENLDDFDLKHLLEKEFLNAYEVIDCDGVSDQRVKIALDSYIMSYSALKFVLDENITIKPIIVSNCNIIDFNEIKNNAICELLAKDIANLPQNYLTPSTFVTFMKNIVTELNIDVEMQILNNKQIKENNLNLIDAIASSNDEENFVVLLQSKKNNKPTTHLFGKGVCYDAGGYSIKTNNSMRSMKADMGGAANAFGIFLGNQLNNGSNLITYLGLVQNLLSNPSLLPDQVITTRDNIKVEITNTDSEGRILIADLISLANDNINKGDDIITFATLTDIAKSMGRFVNSSFTNNLGYYQTISNVASSENEYIWPLPLDQFNDIYGKKVANSSQIADIANSYLPNLEANSIFAANFMYYFLKDKTNDFIHFDIGSTGWRNQKAHAPLVRTIIKYLKIR